MLRLSPLPRTLTAAIRDVQHKKVDVRVSALRDLALLANAREPAPSEKAAAERRAALDAIISALGDGVARVRAEAAVGLADADARHALPTLLKLAADADAHVRQMTLIAIGELSEPSDQEALDTIERAVRDELPALRFQGLIAASRVLGARALPVMLEHLSDDDAKVRYIALRISEEHLHASAGGELAAEVLESARQRLQDEAADVRLAAAILLARNGDRSGAEVIAEAVTSSAPIPEPEDEQAAIELVGELGLHAGRNGLLRRAWRGFFSRERFAWQARVALATMGDDRARNAIVRDLSARSFDTRSLAVAAAGRARIREARPVLLAMRGDERTADQSAVTEALELLAESEN